MNCTQEINWVYFIVMREEFDPNTNYSNVNCSVSMALHFKSSI